MRSIAHAPKYITRFKCLFLFFFVIGFFLYVSPNNVFAATKCWIGSAGGSWSTAGNWSPSGAPGSADDVQFDPGVCGSGAGTNTNSTVDGSFTGTVKSITITAGYTQTITQSHALTINGNTGFVMSGGIWNQGANQIDMTGATNPQFTISGGTFNGGSGNLNVESSSNGADFTLSSGAFTAGSGTVDIADNLTVSGGTFTASTGTFQLDAKDGSSTLNATVTFNNLTFTDGTCNTTHTVSTSVVVSGILTLSGGCTDILSGAGGISAQGNIVTTSTGFLGSLVITINGTGAQSLIGENDTDTKIPAININKSSGILTIGNASTTSSIVEENGWTYTAGTVDVSTNSSTIYAAGDGAFGQGFTFTGSMTFYNLNFEENGTCNDGWIIGSGSTLTVLNTLTMDAGASCNDTIDGPGQIFAQGNISTGTGHGEGGAVAITLAGSGNQTITASGSSFPSGTVTFNKSGGTVTLASNWGISNSGQDLLVQAGSTQTITGAFTLTVADQFQISGTLNQGTTTFINGSSGAFNLTKSGTWNNTSTGDMTVGSGGVTNNGIMNFNTQNTCGSVSNSNIQITSTSGGAARSWTGFGHYNFYDVTVQDQNESPQRNQITLWSSTINSNVNFQNRSDCPKAPSAYWKFDEGTGTTTSDASGSGSTGTLAGATIPTWQTEDQCVDNKCLYFGGTTSKVTVANVIKSVQSVGLWVRPNTLNATNALIDLDGGTHKITSNSSGVLTATGFSSPTIYVNGVSGGSISVNRWNYVEVTTGTAFDTTSSLAIGTDGTNFTKGFFDEVKLYSYARSGTQIASDYVTKGGYTGSSEQAATPPNNGNAFSDGLVGYWKMDESAGANSGVGYNGTSGEAVDSSGNGNNGTFNGTKGVTSTAVASCGCSSTTLTVSGTPWTASGLVNFKLTMTSGSRSGETSIITANTNHTLTFSPALTGSPANGNTFTISDMGVGKFGNSGAFNGINNYIDLPNNSSLHNATGTFSTWYKSTSDTDQVLFGVTQAASTANFVVEIGPSTAFCTNELIAVEIDTGGLRDCYTTTNRNELFDGNWHHIVVTADGNSTKIYLDGAQKTLTIGQGTDSGAFTQSGSYDTFRIGNVKSSGTDADFVNGTMDGVRVYNRALSFAEVSQLYNFAPGPVGRWDFEEGSGTTVHDTSGNANDGTWQGTLGSQWKPGKYGEAGNFNGGDNFVQVANSSSLTLANQYSVEAWINPSSSPGSNTNILAKGGSSGDNYDIRWGGGPGPSCYHTSGGVEKDATFTTIPPTNTWTHLTCTYDGTNIKAYYNGTLQATTAATAPETGTGVLTIGNWWNGSSFFPGKIDAVRIYNYPKTQKQVIEDMNAGHPAPGSPVGTPVGWWRFDEGYGTSGSATAHNSGNCGSTCDLTENVDLGLTGSLSWTNSGKFGKAVTLTGDYFGASDISRLKITGALTLSAWIKGKSAGGGVQPIIAKSSTSGIGAKAYELYLDNSSKLNFQISADGSTISGSSSGQTVTGNTALTSTSTWYHVVGVFDPGNTMTVYVNGIQDGQITSSVPASINSSTVNFYIGTQDAPGTWFNGTIDEAKIFAGALTADQVKLDMNRGATERLGNAGNNSSYETGAANQEYCIPGDSTSCAAPKGRWDFDEGSGTTINDSSGNGNSGTWHGTSSHYKPGKHGASGNFVDSKGDYINVTCSGCSLDTLYNSSGMSISFWTYVTGTLDGNNRPTFENFISKASDGNPTNGWVISGTTTNLDISFEQDCGTQDLDVTSATNQLTANAWNFVEVTWTGGTATSTVHLYANGKEVSYQGITEHACTGGIVSDAGHAFNIGIDGDGGTIPGTNRAMTAKMDDVRAFNYVRTPAQVAYDYNRGGPVAWYRFDECSGTSLHDSSGNGYTETLNLSSGGTTTVGTCSTSSSAWGGASGNSTTNSGKINNALTFDGTDDRATGTVTNFPTGDFSISTWVYPTAVSGNGVAYVMNAVGLTAGIYMWPGATANGCAAGQVQFGAGTSHVCSTLTVTANTWNHIVQTRSGSTNNIYINGVKDSATFSDATATPTSGCAFIIGGDDTSTCNTPASPFFSGKIDDLRVFNYPLTATQVNQLYNNGAVNFAPASGAP